MLLFNISLPIAFFIVQLQPCNGVEVQYSYKVVSDTKRDLFAKSLATAHQRLVIGAPWGKYILPEPGVKVHGPEGDYFGGHLDMNERFMVASGYQPASVYVYPSTHPYTLVARIQVDHEVMDVKVLDDNTIIIANGHGYVAVYEYNHGCSWSKHQNIILDDCDSKGYISLAVSHHVLAVGYWSGHGGRVNIYKKVNNQYTISATLRQSEDEFGGSVAIEGQHLVVSSHKYDSILFTYELDPSGGKWKLSGRLIVPNPYTDVSLQNGILAVTVIDPDNNPEVCAYVYKLSKNSHTTTNSTNNSVNNDSLFSWKKVATLKTNGMPMAHNQYHGSISVQQGLIFTGRVDHGVDYGVVFVHDINKE